MNLKTFLNPAGFGGTPLRGGGTPASPAGDASCARVGSDAADAAGGALLTALPWVLGVLGVGLGIYAVAREEAPRRIAETTWHYGD